MKHALVLTLALMCGCLVSTHRAWLPGDVVEMKKLSGVWFVHKYGDNNDVEIPRTPWVFSKTMVRAVGRADDTEVSGYLVDVADEQDRSARMEGVFFKLGTETYFESTIDRAAMNNLAELYMVSHRLLTRVEIGDKEMRFFGLHDDALRKAGLEFPQPGTNGVRVNELPTEKWRAIVQKKGRSLFLDSPTVVIRRGPRP